MDRKTYQKIVIFSAIVLKVSFVCSFSISSNCSKTFTESDVINFNSSNYNETTTSFCIVGPIGSHISLIVLARDVSIDGNSMLEINEMTENFTDVIFVTNGTDITEDVYANSITNQVAITYSTDRNNFTSESWFRVTFQIESNDNTTTIYTDPSGVIVSNGSWDKGINYVHTFLIIVEQGNRVYLFLNDLFLNDQTGDFLAIGSGIDVYGGSPAILLMGARNKYDSVIIESNRAYLQLYAKNYTEPWHFSFYYNTSLFIPPTDEPPTTEAPPIPLNVTIQYDVAKENFTGVVIKFAQAIQQYATSYCRGEFFKNGTVSNVTLNVTVVEAAIIDPCLVFVFYVLLSGSDSCVGHRPFLVEDFQYMMDNYSRQIEDQFGRTIMTSCGMDVTVWIVLVAIIACISLTVILIVAMTSRNDNYKKLAKPRNKSDDSDLYEKPSINDTSQTDSKFSLQVKEGFVNVIYNDDEETLYERRSAIMTPESFPFENNDEDELFTIQKISNREDSFATSDVSASSSSFYPSSESSTRDKVMRPTGVDNHIYCELYEEPTKQMFVFQNTLEDTKL